MGKWWGGRKLRDIFSVFARITEDNSAIVYRGQPLPVKQGDLWLMVSNYSMTMGKIISQVKKFLPKNRALQESLDEMEKSCSAWRDPQEGVILRPDQLWSSFGRQAGSLLRRLLVVVDESELKVWGKALRVVGKLALKLKQL